MSCLFSLYSPAQPPSSCCHSATLTSCSPSRPHAVLCTLAVKKIIEVPVEEVRYEDRVTKQIVEKVVYKDREVPSQAVKEVPKFIEVEKVRYVDKPVEKIVKVDRNVYKDNIIEVEKTVYVDVPVEMENQVTEVQEKFTEVPVEVVVFKDRVVEVPVEKIVFKDNVQTVTQEKVVEREVEKVVEVQKPGKKGAYTKDWSAEIAAAKNELAMLQKRLTEAQNAKVTKTPPSSYMASDDYGEVISPMQRAQQQQQTIVSPMAQPMDMNYVQRTSQADSGRMCGIGESACLCYCSRALKSRHAFSIYYY